MGWQDRHYNKSDYQPPDGGRPQMRFQNPLTGVYMVKWLLAINIAVFIIDMMMNGARGLGPRAQFYTPSGIGGFEIGLATVKLQLWRWFTYQFLHAHLGHLFFNMLALFFFGPIMERWWGSKRFLVFYLLCGASGAWFYSLLVGMGMVGSGYLVGASGSLFGILAGCALVAPNRTVMLIIPPIPMKMRTMALVVMGIAVFVVLTGGENAGGEAAHLGGAILGYLLVRNAALLNFVDKVSVGDIAEAHEQRKRERERRKQREADAEVDRLLIKVKEHGLQSLTDKEKKTLNRRSDQLKAG